jgi:predicted RNA-binding Zn ribbon-like protein
MTTAHRQAVGDLEIVRAFVNTRDVEEETDSLSGPEGLRDWLATQGLMEGDAPVRADDVGLAHDVREAIRALLLCNNEGCDPDRKVVLALNDAAALAQLSVRFHEDGSAHLEPTVPGVPGALGRLLAIVYGSRREGSWDRLKVCRSDTCRWAFFDESKNRSRHWCSMAVCGSQSKARAYRRRQARQRGTVEPRR